jgi:hypothetical protein
MADACLREDKNMSHVKRKRYFVGGDGPSQDYAVAQVEAFNRKRDAPDWALHDDQLKTVLMRVFPKCGILRYEARKAERWAYVIRKFYSGASTGVIAASLGVTNQVVCSILYRARHAAAGLRTDGTARHGKRGRPPKSVTIIL